jgi:membrane-associated phospholipid phosphatase
MLILGITALAMAITGVSLWLLALRWAPLRLAPRVDPGRIRSTVHRHPRLAAAASSRLDPSSATGLALTAALAVVVVGAVGFGVVLVMVRTNAGFAHFDLGAARFAARHASPASTNVLRAFSQLGGAVVLVPMTIAVGLVAARRYRFLPVAGFLVLTVGGQFAVADLIKAIVDRARPNIDRLTGFSGPSFPSGHAVAAAASFAAFALLAGIGRSSRVRASVAAVAVALAVGIGCTRVFLGVHWLTDVLGGLALGWTWFALCSIAFGGRLLRFGAPAEQAKHAVEAEHGPEVPVGAEHRPTVAGASSVRGLIP